MNLKLDTDSIRVRMNYDEAIRLVLEGESRECFPIFSDSLEVCVSPHTKNLCFVENTNGKSFRLYIPKEKLETILEAAVKNNNPKKEECEMHDILQIGGRPIEIRFEVDRFSMRRMGT